MNGNSYQNLNVELDAVLAKLQDPDVHVDDAVKLYEQGMRLVTQLEKHLQAAENKLTKLKHSK